MAFSAARHIHRVDTTASFLSKTTHGFAAGTLKRYRINRQLGKRCSCGSSTDCTRLAKLQWTKKPTWCWLFRITAATHAQGAYFLPYTLWPVLLISGTESAQQQNRKPGVETCGPREHLTWPVSEVSLLSYSVQHRVKTKLHDKEVLLKSRKLLFLIVKGRILGSNNWFCGRPAIMHNSSPASDVPQFMRPVIINRFPIPVVNNKRQLLSFVQIYFDKKITHTSHVS